MNKTELKNFAISARRDLIEKVALRAKTFGIDEKNSLHIEEQFGQLVINGSTYSLQMRSAFQLLASELKVKGYKQLIEEVAYTWFNRIIAIRYMEVHDYLPERVNVLSSSTGKIEPDILSQFETMDLNIDMVVVKDLVRQGETEQAFRKLLIAQCNALNTILPFMFERINDYTELLLPDFLLDRESVISRLVNNAELTESFSEVEVVGWLYQFYNSEPKDEVFANLKKNKKIDKYDIPAATQLFTPKWIVQYMVENSLGQLWLEANPESSLKHSMKYYIEPAQQVEGVAQRLEEIRYKNVNLEDIRVIDPCAGSGHILVYAFDLLYQMYEEAGYPSGDIPQLILKKNLFGLDIDERAIQLASFTLMMKAREKSRRTFRKHIDLNIVPIFESNSLDKEGITQLLGETEADKEEIRLIIEGFYNAKNFGSILQPPKVNYNKYLTMIEELEETQLTIETFQVYEQLLQFKNLLKQAEMLNFKYDVSITNPPYMGTKGMNLELNNYVKKNYPKSKTDLYGVFIERCNEFTKHQGFLSLVTMHSWMFISSFEGLRLKLIRDNTFLSILHLGMEAFEGIIGKVVQTVAVVLRNTNVPSYTFKGVRLVDFFDSLRWEKEQQFFNPVNTYTYQGAENFLEVPNSPIAYWSKKSFNEIFKKGNLLKELGEPRRGLQTGNAAGFIRLWHEVNIQKTNLQSKVQSNVKWFLFNNGGKSRKWYGNVGDVVNWEENGSQIKKFGKSIIPNEHLYFKESICWNKVTSNSLSVRINLEGMLQGDASPFLYIEENFYQILGFMNSVAAKLILEILSPTLNFQVGDIGNLPIINPENISIKNRIEHLVKENIAISEKDWHSFEKAWDFKTHPLCYLGKNSDNGILDNIYKIWKDYLVEQYTKIKNNEEEMNQIFINLYGFHGEITPEVMDEEIKIRKADRVSDTKSLLSYFIGCAMGRYSLDVEGVAYAGGVWEDLKYNTFIPNKYGLIHLTDEHYFENDIIALLREFLAVTFSAETIEENLQWLAESLELRRSETAEDRLRRYFLEEFFKDHCQVYQKRPIYWLVDSGKQKGLRTLIYMHRYQPDTMATIRFEHLQEIQAKYNNEIAAVDLRIVNPNLSATEKRDLEKLKATYQKRLEELLEFDKKLAEYANAQISIDLDDGVNVNYPKFDKVLAEIK